MRAVYEDNYPSRVNLFVPGHDEQSVIPCQESHMVKESTENVINIAAHPARLLCLS